MILSVKLENASYDIEIARGGLQRAGEKLCRSGRRFCVVTDSGVPREYSERLLRSLGADAILHTFPCGEENKGFDTLRSLLRALLDAGFTRSDAVIALGGGVVGDLAGFAAAIYMRGIDYYGIPTTLLSQVDSSVGGKTAIDLDGCKNMIGAFHQPKAVFIDPELLVTLPPRHISNGLCEALKMGATSDPELFKIFEENDIISMLGAGTLPNIIDEIIVRAITVKRGIVELDEREGGIRKVLNFGHTLGHAVESASGLSMLHGECVALGIPPMCRSAALRSRLCRALHNIGLDSDASLQCDMNAVYKALSHDKKGTASGRISSVLLNDIGDFEFAELTPEELLERFKQQALN